jgi:hypothetical protein
MATLTNEGFEWLDYVGVLNQALWDSEKGTTIHQKSHGSEPYFSNTNPK